MTDEEFLKQMLPSVDPDPWMNRKLASLYTSGALIKIRELKELRQFYRNLSLSYDNDLVGLRAYRAARRLDVEVRKWQRRYNRAFCVLLPVSVWSVRYE